MPRTSTATVFLSGTLRDFCRGASRVDVTAASVRGVLEELAATQPELHVAICDETGAVRRHINLFVNSSHVRDLAGLDTLLAPGDVLTILPAVSGG